MEELVNYFEKPSLHKDPQNSFYSNQIRMNYSPMCFEVR